MIRDDPVSAGRDEAFRQGRAQVLLDQRGAVDPAAAHVAGEAGLERGGAAQRGDLAREHLIGADLAVGHHAVEVEDDQVGLEHADGQ